MDVVERSGAGGGQVRPGCDTSQPSLTVIVTAGHGGLPYGHFWHARQLGEQGVDSYLVMSSLSGGCLVTADGARGIWIVDTDGVDLSRRRVGVFDDLN